MKKIDVNENCIGCGACIAIDPEHFDFEGSLSKPINNENLDSKALNDAIDSCPVGAISIVDDNENNHPQE